MACPVPPALAHYADRLRIGIGGTSPRRTIENAMTAFVTLPSSIRAARVSEWSMYYFGSLIIPTILHAVCNDRFMRVVIDDMSCETDADGRVCGFRLRDDTSVSREALVDTLATDHLEIMIATCHRLSGLSPRVLWSNAAVILDFVVGELQQDGGGSAALHAAEDLLAGRRHSMLAPPFHDGARRERKICCLRYRLSHAGICSGICPRERNAVPAVCLQPSPIK